MTSDGEWRAKQREERGVARRKADEERARPGSPGQNIKLSEGDHVLLTLEPEIRVLKCCAHFHLWARTTPSPILFSACHAGRYQLLRRTGKRQTFRLEAVTLAVAGIEVSSNELTKAHGGRLSSFLGLSRGQWL